MAAVYKQDQEYNSLAKGRLPKAELERPAIAVCHSFPDWYALVLLAIVPFHSPLGSVETVEHAMLCLTGPILQLLCPQSSMCCICQNAMIQELVSGGSKKRSKHVFHAGCLYTAG